MLVKEADMDGSISIDGFAFAVRSRFFFARVCCPPKHSCVADFQRQCLVHRGANDYQRMEEHPMSDLERIIRLKTVLARTGLSRSTMYRKIAEGTFPCQLKISVHGAGWRESAVNRWIANPIAYREEPQEQSCP
jgi:prophage regulatory protein